MESLASSSSVNKILRRSGKQLHSLGRGVFDEEILCAQLGGDRLPAILITAGTHTPEAAGVFAAIRLLEQIRTDHRTYMVPMRDPFGFNDFSHCMSTLVGREVLIQTHEDAVAVLESSATIIWREPRLLIGNIGKHSVALFDSADERQGWERAIERINELFKEQPSVQAALRGRRIFMPPQTPTTEGTGRFGRTYTAVVDSDGKLLSLSQFFGRPEAPLEVSQLESFVRAIRPGVTFDCHEDNYGEAFYMPARRLAGHEAESEMLANAMLDAVSAGGYPLADFEGFISYHRDARPFWPPYQEPGGRPGLFWTDGLKRGIGHILVDFNLQFGYCMPTESSMEAPLEDRIDCHVRAVLAGIAMFETLAAGLPT
jgi:hypothetical protein